MCLIINREKTDKFRRQFSENKKLKVYKVVRYDEKTRNLYTPYKDVLVEEGFLEGKSSDGFERKTNEITDNAIHCYLLVDRAIEGLEIWRRSGPPAKYILLTCWANTEDFIAIGDIDDVCFKKIYISKSELKVALTR